MEEDKLVEEDQRFEGIDYDRARRLLQARKASILRLQRLRLLRIVVKSFLPRCLLIGHGIYAISDIVDNEKKPLYWLMTLLLFLLVLEGMLILIFRKGREFDLVSPSIFLYSILIIVIVSVGKTSFFKCIDTLRPPDPMTEQYCTSVRSKLQGISMVEQTALLVLIICRWIMPKGSISMDKISQIALIYIGIAADILEFAEIYSLAEGKAGAEVIYKVTLAFWAISLFQFTFSVALPEEGLKSDKEIFDERDTTSQTRIAPISYFQYKTMLGGQGASKGQLSAFQVHAERLYAGNDKTRVGSGSRARSAVDLSYPDRGNNEHHATDVEAGIDETCIHKHADLLDILLPVFLMDGPFLTFRVALMAHFDVQSNTMLLLAIKNAMIIIAQSARLVSLYCVPKKRPKTMPDDASIRLRAALDAVRHAAAPPSTQSKQLWSKVQDESTALKALSLMKPGGLFEGQSSEDDPLLTSVNDNRHIHKAATNPTVA